MFNFLKIDRNPIIDIKKFSYSWMNTHTQLCIPYSLDEKHIRLFFNSRTNGKTRPTYVDIDENFNVVYKNEEPLLEFGMPGTFDDCGVMFSSVVERQGKLYMYYSGWNEPRTVRYHNSIGLAISEDRGRTFYKYSEGPIMDRSTSNPIMVAGPYVIYRNQDDWIMYYLSCSEWINGKDKMEPVYDLHYALSRDGIKWMIPQDCSTMCY